jgi:hypothetical protein
MEDGKIRGVVSFDPWVWDSFVGDALCVGLRDTQDGNIWIRELAPLPSLMEF